MALGNLIVTYAILAGCLYFSNSLETSDCEALPDSQFCAALVDNDYSYLQMLQKKADLRVHVGVHASTAHRHAAHSPHLASRTASSVELVVPTPMFTSTYMPRVSAALQCIVNLCMQYFFIYALRAVLGTINELTGYGHVGALRVLETACTTVTYAPMLSMLFLAALMRANQLTQGRTELYSLPQPWVEGSMHMCSYAVLIQLILVLLMPICTGEWDVSTDKDGHLDLSKMEVAGSFGAALTVIRYVVMAMLYIGNLLVCIGIIVMEPPLAIWGDSPIGVSPAVQCTMTMSILFFVVYLLVAVTKSCIELIGTSPFLEKLEGTLTLAKFTVNLTPMLCVLFLAARMRALQIDPLEGKPQTWAQACFYLCTFSILVQVLLVVVMPFLMDCKCERGMTEGDIVFTVNTDGMAETTGAGVEICTTALRYGALFATYIGFTVVVISIVLIKNQTDPSLTPGISPAMTSVITLNVCYLSIYLGLFVCVTIKQFTTQISSAAEDLHKYMGLTRLIDIFDGVQKIVMFAPMMCALFIGTRMRALQLARGKDGSVPLNAGPPTWVQSMMILATYSVVLQLIFGATIPLALGTPVPLVDEHGQVKAPEDSGKTLAVLLEAFRYLCMMGMYGGVIAIIVGVYHMTPETVQPYGS